MKGMTSSYFSVTIYPKELEHNEFSFEFAGKRYWLKRKEDAISISDNQKTITIETKPRLLKKITIRIDDLDRWKKWGKEVGDACKKIVKELQRLEKEKEKKEKEFREEREVKISEVGD